MATETPNYTVEDIAHFMLCLLIDESKDDIIADIIMKLMKADLLHSCLHGEDACLRFQEEMIEEVKTWDAPFDECRIPAFSYDEYRLEKKEGG